MAARFTDIYVSSILNELIWDNRQYCAGHASIYPILAGFSMFTDNLEYPQWHKFANMLKMIYDNIFSISIEKKCALSYLR